MSAKNNTRVRKITATSEEFLFLCDAAEKHIPTIPHYAGQKVDKDRVWQMLKESLDNDDRMMVRLLVNEDNVPVGMVAGYCVTLLFNWNKMTGDILLFLTEEYRTYPNLRKLMVSYRDWALAQGASIITASHTGGYRTPEMDAMLRREGYKSVGSIYHLEKTGV